MKKQLLFSLLGFLFISTFLYSQYSNPNWKDPLGRYYGNSTRFLAEIQHMEILENQGNLIIYKYTISNLPQSPQAIESINFVFENGFPLNKFPRGSFYIYFNSITWKGSLVDYCYRCIENGITDEKHTSITFYSDWLNSNIKSTIKKISSYTVLHESNSFLTPGLSMKIEIPMLQKESLPGLISIRIRGEAERPSMFTEEEEDMPEYLPGYKNFRDTKKFTAIGGVLKKSSIEAEAGELESLLYQCWNEKWIKNETIYQSLRSKAAQIYARMAEDNKTAAKQGLNEFLNQIEINKNTFTHQAAYMMFKIRAEYILNNL